MADMHEDVLIACADLAGRAGAREFEVAWDCPHVPDEPEGHACEQTTWSASVRYQGARVIADGHKTPSAAALELAERLLSGATCRCRQPVALSDDKPGCRWRLVGQRWEPSCDVPPIRVDAGRGDLAAMRRALLVGNRAQRRAAKKRRGGHG